MRTCSVGKVRGAVLMSSYSARIEGALKGTVPAEKSSHAIFHSVMCKIAVKAQKKHEVAYLENHCLCNNATSCFFLGTGSDFQELSFAATESTKHICPKKLIAASLGRNSSALCCTTTSMGIQHRTILQKPCLCCKSAQRKHMHQKAAQRLSHKHAGQTKSVIRCKKDTIYQGMKLNAFEQAPNFLVFDTENSCSSCKMRHPP